MKTNKSGNNLGKIATTIFAVVLVTVLFLGISKFNAFVSDLRNQQIIAISQLAPSVNERPLNEDNSETSKVNSEYQASSDQNSNEQKVTTEDNQEAKKERRLEKTFEFLDEKPLIITCDLVDLLAKTDKSSQEDHFKRYSAIFRFQPNIAPLLYQAHLPYNREVLIAAYDDPSLIKNAEFVLKLYQAKSELESYIETAKLVQVQGYYSFIFAKVLQKNPSLLGDSDIKGLCTRLTNTEAPPSRDEMNQEIYRFMERAQVRPEEVGFDPNFTPSVSIKWGEHGFFYFSGFKPEEEKLPN